ncbi:hypothetical protein HDU92_000795 [Lobulomyces angularis]|nr:hypothetical protein HDU92_000795 [Lobulomyces angularis]
MFCRIIPSVAKSNTRFMTKPLNFLKVSQNGLSALQFRSYADATGSLDKAAIESRVLNLLKDFDKVTQGKLSLDSHFVKDLGLDSLDQVEIVMALEDEFNVELPDKVAEEIFTGREAVEKVLYNFAN